MTLHSNLLHMYIVVVSSNVPLAEQETQISYVPSQSTECMSTAFWYLPPFIVSLPHVRAFEPLLLRQNFTSDVTAGAPGWPHLEDGKLLELLLELLGPCPWSPAMPWLCTQFQHFLIHPCLKSHYWCSSKISFSSPARGRKHLDCIILPTSPNTPQGNSFSVCAPRAGTTSQGSRISSTADTLATSLLISKHVKMGLQSIIYLS